MLMTRTTIAVIVCAAFAAGIAAHSLFTPVATVHAAGNRVFEIRTYTTPPGKLEALKSRFRDHTIKLFEKQGMKASAIGCPRMRRSRTTRSFTSWRTRAARRRRRAGRRSGAIPTGSRPEAESEKDGPLTTKVESVFADPTDFSAIK